MTLDLFILFLFSPFDPTEKLQAMILRFFSTNSAHVNSNHDMNSVNEVNNARGMDIACDEQCLVDIKY